MPNELRRASDRLESLMVFTLVMTFLAGAPLLGWWAGQQAYRTDLRAQRWEREHTFEVQAVLRGDPVPSVGGRTGATLTARATWTAPDGSPREGAVPVTPDDAAGSRIRIWTDDRGTPRQPPPQRQPAAQGVMVGAAVVLCAAAATAGLHRIGRALIDRRRYRAWEREWLEVGPRWSRDRR
ncbi:Rv1733c family protein [Paractinoplanes deccanensis]|uniref:Rv1733c family protein n=1 Tax=Paractinoplanes deccanensis TaxID=113561 RepID=UPI001EF188B4|nr:hypothetical protein [Actinoplanes deccanensis]